MTEDDWVEYKGMTDAELGIDGWEACIRWLSMRWRNMASNRNGIDARAWFYSDARFGSGGSLPPLYEALAADGSHGTYATLQLAHAAARYDKLSEYQIWLGNTRVCDAHPEVA